MDFLLLPEQEWPASDVVPSNLYKPYRELLERQAAQYQKFEDGKAGRKTKPKTVDDEEIQIRREAKKLADASIKDKETIKRLEEQLAEIKKLEMRGRQKARKLREAAVLEETRRVVNEKIKQKEGEIVKLRNNHEDDHLLALII